LALTQSSANADIFVLIEKSTKNVVAISDNKNEFVISDTDKDKFEIKSLPNDLASYALEGEIEDYKISGNKFVLNTAKRNQRQIEKEKAEEVAEERRLIEKEMINAAIDKLTEKGIILKHFSKQ
jgi:hypothetical protein